ncbi:DUF3574 domain-containing protein [Hydrocarboniphaga effusa]|uniref:DUF3574 domain-containing protein n=1 Tax=Hydrocarboniphaga effusa TaxID=243629 RepID=UPI003BA8A2BE
MNLHSLLCAAMVGASASLVSLPVKAADDAPAVRQMLRTELYFTAIDAAQWDTFLAEVVTPRFPDGLTWYDVHGQWRGPSGKPEKLPSRLLIVLHADNRNNERALVEVGALFKQRFGYSVLRASAKVEASDPDWTTDRVNRNPQLTPQSRFRP